MSRPSLAALLALAVMATGCDNSPKLVDVEGTVTLKGKPLEQVRVEFHPLSEGPQSAALTDDQGRFTLRTMDDTQAGAVVGKHKVVLRDVSIIKVPFRGRANEDVDMSFGEKPRISIDYTNVMKTPLEADITGEQRDLVFDVKPFKP